MSPSKSNPEVYWTKPSVVAPNSRFPVLVYRNVLSVDGGLEAMQQAIESNHWLKGGIWGHISKPHYHSNTHECYAPISGWTKCLYGASGEDNPSDGVRFGMKAGDVAVHPAGVAHCHLESSDDYRYFGFYPEGSPKWDSVYDKISPEVKAQKVKNAETCPIPEYDPVFGLRGPLPRLWLEADQGM